MSWSAIALGLTLGLARSAHAQSCPTTLPSTVTVNMTGTITYPDDPPEVINRSLTHTQNANQCTDNPTGLNSLVCPPAALTPFTAVLGAKILQIIDRTPQGRGLLDISCGHLTGTLTIGEPSLTLASGTVTLQFLAPSTVNATVTMNSSVAPGFFTNVPGRSTLAEVVVFNAPGRAAGTGTFRLDLNGEILTVPFTTAYQMLGNPNQRPNDVLKVDTDLTYNCASSQVTSRLCLVGPGAAVPLPRKAALGLGLGLLALGGFALARTRKRAARAA